MKVVLCNQGFFHGLFTLIYYYTYKDQRIQIREANERPKPHPNLRNHNQPVFDNFWFGWFFNRMAAFLPITQT